MGKTTAFKSKPAGEVVELVIKLVSVKANSAYTLEIFKGGKVAKTISGTWKDGTENKDGVPIKISGLDAKVQWKGEGPDPTGKERGHRVFARMKVTDAKNKEHTQASQEIDVYLDTMEITAEDANGPVKGASFKLLLNERPPKDEPKQGTTNADGKCKLAPVGPGSIGLEPQRPYALEKITEAKATTLKAKVYLVKKVAITAPRPAGKAKVVKQFVNLPADDPKRTDLGSKVKVELQVKDGKAGDKVFIRHSFKNKSKRTDPAKVGLVGAAVTDWAEDGGLELAADAKGKASVDVEMGKAGGLEVHLEVGGSKKCGDGQVKLVAWRRLLYQISAPAALAPPSMDRMGKALGEGFIEYVELKTDRQTVVEAGAPPGTWFPLKALGRPGEGKGFVVGGHNHAKLHDAYFKSAKKPVAVHLLYAHEQLEEAGFEQVQVEVKAADLQSYPDGSKGVPLLFTNPVFSYHLSTGNDGFKEGSWKETGGKGRSGKFAKADMLVVEGRFIRVASVRLSTEAQTALKEKSTLTVTVTHATVLAFGGWADGRYQAMIAKKDVKLVNDTMCHELGHAINQAVHPSYVPAGLAHRDHGRQYTEHGHNGSHCADGLSQTWFDEENDYTGLSECTCVMYGGGNEACTGLFCKRCKPFLQAQDLSTLPGREDGTA